MADNSTLQKVTTIAPAPPHDGETYYDPSQNVEFIYTNGAWQPINAAASGFSLTPTFTTVAVTNSLSVGNQVTFTNGPVFMPSAATSLKVADTGGQVYNITSIPYGAIPKSSAGDTSHDCTSIIQTAITNARDAGGGVVWVPPSIYGWYCAGQITIYTGVTLKGAGAGSPGVGTYERTSTLGAEYQYRGSELHTTANSGVTTASLSFITVNRNAKIWGISIFYPNQTATNPPVLYPPAIQFQPDTTGKYGGGAVVDCTLVNPYIAIRAVSHDYFYISGVRGQALNTGIVADDIHTNGSIENVDFWSFWKEWNVAPTLDAYTNANGIAFNFLDVDGLNFKGCRAWNFFTGFNLGTMSPVNGPSAGGFGSGVNLMAENCQRGIVVNNAHASGWNLANIDIITAGAGGVPITLGVGRGILVNSSEASTSAEVQISRCVIENGRGIGVEIAAAAHLPVKLNQVRIHDWDTGGGASPYTTGNGPAIRTSSTDSDLQLSSVTFWDSTGAHLDVSSIDSTATAVISWNGVAIKNRGAANTPQITVGGGTKPQIHGLTSGGLAQVANGTATITVTHTLGVIPYSVTLLPLATPQSLTYWASGFTTTQFVINTSANVSPALSFSWTVQAGA